MGIMRIHPSDLPDIFYEEPERVEDGMQKAEALWRIRRLLYNRYEKRADVLFAGGYSYIMYNRNNGYDRIDPDCYITFNVNAERILKAMPNFWVWDVGKTPDFALEMASPSTVAADLGRRRDMYQRLGISEYWRLDHTGGELYGQPVLGERLVDGAYVPYEVYTEVDGSVVSYSELLDLIFCWNEVGGFDILNPVDKRTIDPFVIEREARLVAEARGSAAREARLAEEARADVNWKAWLAAKAGLRELQEEIERLSGQR